MKSMIIAVVLAVGVAAAGSANASEALAKSSGCLKCHAVDVKKKGPSFQETAKKYKGNAGAEAKLVALISAGKDHPEVKASGDDLKTLVKWVLAQ
jgi:cytochrome c